MIVKSTPRAPGNTDGDPRSRGVHGQGGRHRRVQVGAGGRIHHLCQTEIQHLHRTVVANLDVRGFQVPMDDALRVRRLERVSDLPGCRREKVTPTLAGF